MNGTRFTWKIENFSCLKYEVLESPPFSSHSTTWDVKIYPAVPLIYDYFEFGLCARDYRKKYQKLHFSLAFLDFEGTPLVWQEKKYVDFSTNFQTFRHGKEKFELMKKRLVHPNDVLTVECHIWQTADELVQVNSCFARTCFEPLTKVTEEIVSVKIIGVSSLLPNQIQESDHSVTKHGDMVKIKLYFNREETLKAEIILPVVSSFDTCKISLLDIMGKHIQFADKGFDYKTKDKKYTFCTEITRDMLRCNQLKFLPNDTLTLVFEFTMSGKVTFSGAVDETEMGFCNSRTSMHNPIPTSVESESKKLNESSNKIEPLNRSEKPETINQVLRSMYEEGYMSDFSLRVGDKSFPVHKAILGARSSVFRAMFAADMKEKESGSVDIPDVDPGTIQRMLKFVYYDSVQDDMQWESASSLYKAADKYALESLKQRCSDILKSELRASSALGTLVLGAMYQDHGLESAALEFIARNDKLIIGTELWCQFEEDNPKIAIQVLRKLYVKKMNG